MPMSMHMHMHNDEVHDIDIDNDSSVTAPSIPQSIMMRSMDGLPAPPSPRFPFWLPTIASIARSLAKPTLRCEHIMM